MAGILKRKTTNSTNKPKPKKTVKISRFQETFNLPHANKASKSIRKPFKTNFTSRYVDLENGNFNNKDFPIKFRLTILDNKNAVRNFVREKNRANMVKNSLLMSANLPSPLKIKPIFPAHKLPMKYKIEGKNGKMWTVVPGKRYGRKWAQLNGYKSKK